MRIIFTLTFLLQIQAVIAQSNSYAVKVVGLRVGEILSTKSQIKDSIIYKLESKVDVNFLVYHLKVDYRVKSVYVGNDFQYSDVKVVSNRGNYHTMTKKIKNHYEVISKQYDKQKDVKITQKIGSSFAHAFFNEPEKLTELYAEFYADFIKLRPLAKNAYKGILTKNIDEYYYENGLLVKMVKKNPITDMVIVLENPNQSKKAK